MGDVPLWPSDQHANEGKRLLRLNPEQVEETNDSEHGLGFLYKHT